MKFKFILLFFLLLSCNANYTKFENKTNYTSKGFAYIQNDSYKDETIKGKLNNTLLQIAHQDLKFNSLVKIINPKTKKSIVLKNSKRVKYPDFYKIYITQEVAKVLNLNEDLPLVEILELKKNKSFIAKKAKIFNEEKKIPSNAPATSVKISNISKERKSDKISEPDKIFILIASFYSNDAAEFLKKRIIKEIPSFEINKLKIKKKSNKKIDLLSGPYNTVNLMKNDYTLLKKFGFEELDITINE